MRYTSKTLYSKPGLKRETALKALQASPAFRQGSVIEDFKRQGDRWVAKVRVAEFPPPKDEEADGLDSAVESDDDSDEDDDSDDPVVPKGKKDDDGDGDKGKSKEDQILDLLHKVLEAVGAGESDLDPLGDLEDGPVPPPPGDLGLDKPSKKERAKSEGPTGEEMIPTFSSLDDQFRAVAGKLPTVVVSRPDDGKSIKQAKAEVEAAGSKYGYKVAKAVREDGKLRVVASVR
jgi:hypothetical protein